ncbi:uncharacterized protein FPRN_14378 [Fusarium proliferatum]|nr:uncharacterized protein FPRN_14378 [Fusarium proliferatum]
MTQPMVVEDPDHGVGLKQMKEMPTLSAEEIPPTTFHSFPNLATELRLKIWKAACFPYAATKRGLHYINLESIGGNEISGELITQMTAMEMKALHPDFQTSSNLQGVVGRANRSAYMWDAGLWKACRESREFISRHFKLNIWGYIQEKDLDLLDLDECLSKACQLYPWKPRYEELEERPGLESSALFHDYDDAYVEVDNEYFGLFPGKPAEASAMLQFLWRVWALRTVAFCEDCTHDEICEMCQLDPRFDMTEFVKVLVRHEKEPARGQIEDRVDELDELAKGNDCEVEHDSEDDKEVQEASEPEN